MKKFYYGAHYSIVPSIINSLKTLKSDGGNILQIFISNPQGKGIKDRSNDEINEIKSYMKKNNIQLVFHSPYVLNFANPFNPDSWWIKQLIKELSYVSKMGAIGTVIHFGKSKELSREEGIENMYNSLVYVIDNSSKDSRIILETSAGQGTELCYRLDEFKLFFDKFDIFQKDRLGICIDTCHIFAAGYDIRSKSKAKSYLKEFDKYIGLRYVKLIQLNDSAMQLGSRVDRHENLGNGFIGKKGINYFIEFAYKNRIPIVLETPLNENIDEIKYIKNVIKSIRR